MRAISTDEKAIVKYFHEIAARAFGNDYVFQDGDALRIWQMSWESIPGILSQKSGDKARKMGKNDFQRFSYEWIYEMNECGKFTA